MLINDFLLMHFHRLIRSNSKILSKKLYYHFPSSVTKWRICFHCWPTVFYHSDIFFQIYFQIICWVWLIIWTYFSFLCYTKLKYYCIHLNIETSQYHNESLQRKTIIFDAALWSAILLVVCLKFNGFVLLLSFYTINRESSLCYEKLCYSNFVKIENSNVYLEWKKISWCNPILSYGTTILFPMY